MPILLLLLLIRAWRSNQQQKSHSKQFPPLHSDTITISRPFLDLTYWLGNKLRERKGDYLGRLDQPWMRFARALHMTCSGAILVRPLHYSSSSM